MEPSISLVVSNMLTGSHLLRTRSEAQRRLHKELSYAFEKVEDLKPLTVREKELINEASDMFYGGQHDMCGQLGVDEQKLAKLL